MKNLPQFNQLLTKLHTKEDNPDYYKLLLKNLDIVLLQIAHTNQDYTRQQLKIKSQPEMSYTIKILKALQ